MQNKFNKTNLQDSKHKIEYCTQLFINSQITLQIGNKCESSARDDIKISHTSIMCYQSSDLFLGDFYSTIFYLTPDLLYWVNSGDQGGCNNTFMSFYYNHSCTNTLLNDTEHYLKEISSFYLPSLWSGIMEKTLIGLLKVFENSYLLQKQILFEPLLNENNITFIQKNDNPPKFLEAGVLKILGPLKMWRNWQVRDISQLKKRINFCIKKIDMQFIKKLIKSTSKRLKKIRNFGVFETHKNK
ncbi:hypothetical protein ABPG74_002864 [Tetrahymena malaccensis]